MSRSHRRILRIAAPVFGALIALLSALAQAGAQESSAAWVENCRDRARASQAAHCEVRESTLGSLSVLAVEASPNGGIRVTGWDRNDIRVIARIQSSAPSQSEADAIASNIRVLTDGGSVRATGPDTRNRGGWSVSYEVFAPRQIDLELESVNGGLDVDGIRGDLDLATTNGGINLEGVAGDVRAQTTNGGMSVRLAGTSWSGDGLELRTTNGGIDLRVPASFSANLSASTVHGSVESDFPLSVQGRIGRRIDAVLGNGGPEVSLTTVNGGISLRRN